MSLPNKLAMLQDFLEQGGYSGWYATKTNKFGRTDSDAKYILFNFKDGAKAEVVIPDAWFQNPERYKVIEELIRLAIDDYSVPISQPAADQSGHPFFSLGAPAQLLRR